MSQRYSASAPDALFDDMESVLSGAHASERRLTRSADTNVDDEHADNEEPVATSAHDGGQEEPMEEAYNILTLMKSTPSPQSAKRRNSLAMLSPGRSSLSRSRTPGRRRSSLQRKRSATSPQTPTRRRRGQLPNVVTVRDRRVNVDGLDANVSLYKLCRLWMEDKPVKSDDSASTPAAERSGSASRGGSVGADSSRRASVSATPGDGRASSRGSSRLSITSTSTLATATATTSVTYTRASAADDALSIGLPWRRRTTRAPVSKDEIDAFLSGESVTSATSQKSLLDMFKEATS